MEVNLIPAFGFQGKINQVGLRLFFWPLRVNDEVNLPGIPFGIDRYEEPCFWTCGGRHIDIQVAQRSPHGTDPRGISPAPVSVILGFLRIEEYKILIIKGK